MRTTLMMIPLLALSAPLAAQQLPELQRGVPEPPPMPAVTTEDFEPDVTIIKRGEDTVEEYRVRGRLYMIKVTPLHGVPYYLVDRQGDGVLVRQEGARVAVPMWVLHSW